MSRVAVIGNSHVAALALAWQAIRTRHFAHELMFFAAPRDQLKLLEVDGDRLVSNAVGLRCALSASSGGETDIAPNDFDRIVVCGMGFGLRRVMTTYAGFRSEAMHADTARYPLSDKCFLAAARGTLAASGAVTLIRKLRAITMRAVTLVPDPDPSDEIYNDATGGWWKLARENDDRDVIASVYRSAARSAAGTATMAFAPDRARSDSITTHAAFSRGSVGLAAGMDVQHGETDRFHMNADYGALILDTLLA